MATFRLIGLYLSVSGRVICDYFTTGMGKNKAGHQVGEFALMT